MFEFFDQTKQITWILERIRGFTEVFSVVDHMSDDDESCQVKLAK